MDALLWSLTLRVYAIYAGIGIGRFGNQLVRRPVRAVRVKTAASVRPHLRAKMVSVLHVMGTVALAATITGCAVGGRAHNDLRGLPAGDAAAAPDGAFEATTRADQSWVPTPGRSVPPSDESHNDEFRFTHPAVERFAARFQADGDRSLRNALLRSSRYLPRIAAILRQRGLPQELAYLPLIESGFRPHVVSPAGAVGPWQFIAETGRQYGLRIDAYVDERRDPIRSTEAAASYLKDLHATFGNWHLALAAYNGGAQTIARILDKGDAEDFWEMRRRGYLCGETADFVPQFLAALYIAETPAAYGFEPRQEQPLEYDVVNVSGPLSLATIARLSGASTRTIKELNPALYRGMVPPRGYAVRLPKGMKTAFEGAYTGFARGGHQRCAACVTVVKAVAETQQSTPVPAQTCMATTL